MAPCTPIDASDILLPDLPPGFEGLPVPQLPPFDIPLPNLPIEDLLDLFNKLNIILPPGILRPHLSSNFSKDVLDAILSLLEKFMPFLMMYTFFMPILNMILCIIEIFCAFMHPFKLIKAIKRLFRVCIPEFLSLFPYLALIIMIISLLLLILALILYLIQRIIELIKQIIENIRLLVEAVNSLDNDSVIAITIKLGDLLCILQNLFVLLGVIILIFQIIERLLSLSFKLPPCDESDGTDDGCCTPDVCPSFIKNNREITSSTGTLQYYNAVIQTGVVPVTLRQASWQLYDATAPTHLAFNNITHAFDLPEGISQTFFPEGANYTANTNPNSIPYTVDVRFFYNPTLFGRTDGRGARFIRVKNCVILKAPVDGVLNHQNHLVEPFNGTLFISGGTAYEDDGTTIMKVSPDDFGAANLNTIISLPDNITGNLSSGIKLDNVSYTFKINHTILVAESLITLGCHPDVAFDKNFINNTFGAQLNASADALSSIQLPNLQETQECITDAIESFRQNVSVESAELLQTKVLGCLEKLRNDTNKTLESVINAGFDPFKSDFTLDPPIQFTTRHIDVIVSLNEAGGNNITTNIPTEVADTLAHNLDAIVTLGEISDFTYDGYSNFVAKITSDQTGNGTVKVSYNNQFISVIDNPTDTSQTPTISVKELLYTFVQSPAITVGAVRRDEGDVARDGGEMSGGS